MEIRGLKRKQSFKQLPFSCLDLPSKSQAFSDSNFLALEIDKLTLTLCNIWQFSFERVKVLLIVKEKNYISVTILSTSKIP